MGFMKVYIDEHRVSVYSFVKVYSEQLCIILFKKKLSTECLQSSLFFGFFDNDRVQC